MARISSSRMSEHYPGCYRMQDCPARADFVILRFRHPQETECAAVLQQIAAIRGAVNGLMAEVLEGHIREHLGPEAVSPKERREDLEQVVDLLRCYLK
jgi:hypothetical protein